MTFLSLVLKKQNLILIFLLIHHELGTRSQCHHSVCVCNTKKCPNLKKSFKSAGFHSIGAIIRKRRESRCLPYAGFLVLVLISIWFVLSYNFEKDICLAVFAIPYLVLFNDALQLMSSL